MAHTFAPVVAPSPASEPGALDGFEVRCPCGDVATFTFERMATQHAADHTAWHARRR